MKRLPKLLAVGLCSSMILVGCGNSVSTNNTPTSAETTNEVNNNQPTVNTGTNDKDTFDKGTTEYTFDGIKLQVPDGWGKATTNSDDYKRWDISDNNKLGMTTYYTNNLDSNDDTIMHEIITGSGDIDADDSVAEKLKPQNVKKITVGDFEGATFEVTVPNTDSYNDYNSYNAYVAYVINTKKERLDIIVLGETDTARYSYKNDFYKMVDSMKE